MSSFQRARESLGLRLRELRRDGRLTGRQLAAMHGWHPSKISKIEGGKQTPSEDDISAWDSDPRVPHRVNPDPHAEKGRGLFLVEALSARWRWCFPEGRDGKVVWAELPVEQDCV